MNTMPQKPENSPKTPRRATRGSFRPGQSGNPGGRPKKTEAEFELMAACEVKAPEALETIYRLMNEARQESVKLAAATYIIERRYGKPTERKEVRTGPLDGLPASELEALQDAVKAIRKARGAVGSSA